MSTLNVLALSSSRVGNGAYLQSAISAISGFLNERALNIAFIPFAAANNDYKSYVSKVREGLSTLPHTIHCVELASAKQIIEDADVIMVGGGNTFKLLHDLYAHDVFHLIKNKVLNGAPYIGWSAGANITGKTIGTTNDMPIIQPKSFDAFGFLPFQINPHYINIKQEGHNGETRDDRLTEYLLVNTNATIIGIPEGTSLLLSNGNLNFNGTADGVIFTNDDSGGIRKEYIKPGYDLSYLLK